MSDLTSQFREAMQDRAQEIREEKTAAAAPAERQKARADQGAEWLLKQFDQLAADGTPEEPLPASTPTDEDILNHFNKF